MPTFESPTSKILRIWSSLSVLARGRVRQTLHQAREARDIRQLVPGIFVIILWCCLTLSEHICSEQKAGDTTGSEAQSTDANRDRPDVNGAYPLTCPDSRPWLCPPRKPRCWGSHRSGAGASCRLSASPRHVTSAVLCRRALSSQVFSRAPRAAPGASPAPSTAPPHAPVTVMAKLRNALSRLPMIQKKTETPILLIVRLSYDHQDRLR